MYIITCIHVVLLPLMVYYTVFVLCLACMCVPVSVHLHVHMSVPTSDKTRSLSTMHSGSGTVVQASVLLATFCNSYTVQL